MLWMTCFYNQRCSNGLFSQILFKNAPLHSAFQLCAEEINNSQINSTVHQPERVSRTHHTIKFRQLFESSLYNVHVRQPGKSFSISRA